MMSDDQEEKIDKLIRLVEASIVDRTEQSKKHEEDHRYIRSLIEKEKLSAEYKKAIITRVATGGVWALMVGLTSAVVFTVKSWLHS